MAFCPNCGNELKGTPNYCPNCGQKLSDYKFETVNPNMSSNQPQSAAADSSAASAQTGGAASSDTSEQLPVHDVVLVRLDSCPKETCLDLLEDLMGYSTDLAENVIKECPTLIATSLTKKQAVTIAQAFSEYGADMTIYTPDGAINFEGKERAHISANTYSKNGYNGSIYRSDGSMIGLAAAVIGTLTAANFISGVNSFNRPGVYDNPFRPGFTTRPRKTTRPGGPGGFGGPGKPGGPGRW
ncbi:MAG: zinc ribbon domain-containing protein [Firmicutes bacterium]|nr:zinc ribbon domain-containing protein [Bacillota bacterium]